MQPPGDLVEETVALPGRSISLLRPRDSEALLREEAFVHEELLPYWAELWPSGVALARAVSVRALRGARVLELGCGLGLVAIAAALAGGRVLATDWSAEALEATGENARRNGMEVEVARCDWSAPDDVVARGPWDLVLASDVLYEQAQVSLLLDLLPRLVGPRGQAWIADPGRPPASSFLEGADRAWTRQTSVEGSHPAVSVHRLRPL